jgi:hypothetical protein
MVRTEEVDPEPGAHERFSESYRKWRELNDHLDTMSL